VCACVCFKETGSGDRSIYIFDSIAHVVVVAALFLSSVLFSFSLLFFFFFLFFCGV
jgi:hypothetical protein